MKPSMIKRLQQLEKAAGVTPQTHLIWVDCEGSPNAAVEKIAAMKASGRAKEGDQFHTVRWLRSDEGEQGAGLAAPSRYAVSSGTADPKDGAAGGASGAKVDGRIFWGNSKRER
jgi:hypothetical protein